MNFENKITLVTGGSSGIGLGIAKRLARQGARVVITGRDAAKLERAAKDIGTGASWLAVEIGKVADIEAMFASVRQDHGRLDIVVANAGGGEMSNLGAITEEQVDRTFAANVKGVIFTVQGALPLMQAGGSIVIVGSTASFNPPMGMSVYGASKAAVRNLVRPWIQEIKGSGIRINVVSPGPVRTPGMDTFVPAEQAAAVYGFMESQSTVGRIGIPEDIAEAVAFLASDATGYINGIELFVDGGASQI
jgi:NAD(P)-dependent dehydrogenase (short-subunit alcohol dehydrogenase family)